MEPDTHHSQLSLEDVAAAETDHSVTFGQSLLALNKVPRLGRKGIRALVEKFGDALSQIWTYKPEQLAQVLLAARIASSQEVAHRIYEDRKELLKQGKNEAAYLGMQNKCVLAPSQMPPRLKDIRHPPLWLFVEGETGPLYHEPAIAVVGTRKASDKGREAASVVSQILAAYPVTLVSGLADGIDNEAHLSSMREGVTNIAFLGHGIDHVFPASTADTRKQIVSSGGTVVTEYLPGERYKGSYFVERNRLQAALASLVIPVEANPQGGTAHTVRFARELQRILIGIRWDGANGILEQLTRDNVPIVDIFKLEGGRRLDQFIRQVSEQAGHETNALSLAIRILKRETERRFFREEDLQLLKQIVEQESSETASEENDV